MTPLQISGGTPIDCSGTAEERGLAQAANATAADMPEILAATVGRVATARAYDYFGLTAPGKERLW